MPDKKQLAAVAAVMQYLREEQLQAAAAAPPPAEEPKRFTAAIPDTSMLPPVRPYSLSGRNAQMQTRVMMQLKAFRG